MGDYPRLVVEMMSKIILEVERTAYDYDRDDILAPQAHSPSLLSDALCYSACKLAKDVNANALIGMTQSGYTGFILSSYRPKAPLFIFSKEKTLINQLSLSWGVRAIYYAEEETLDTIIADQLSILKDRGYVKTSDVVVSTGSTPTKLHLPTNTIKITIVK
jgi:pyruvate kinase